MERRDPRDAAASAGAERTAEAAAGAARGRRALRSLADRHRSGCHRQIRREEQSGAELPDPAAPAGVEHREHPFPGKPAAAADQRESDRGAAEKPAARGVPVGPEARDLSARPAQRALPGWRRSAAKWGRQTPTADAKGPWLSREPQGPPHALRLPARRDARAAASPVWEAEQAPPPLAWRQRAEPPGALGY